MKKYELADTIDKLTEEGVAQVASSEEQAAEFYPSDYCIIDGAVALSLENGGRIAQVKFEYDTVPEGTFDVSFRGDASKKDMCIRTDGLLKNVKRTEPGLLEAMTRTAYEFTKSHPDFEDYKFTELEAHFKPLEEGEPDEDLS